MTTVTDIYNAVSSMCGDLHFVMFSKADILRYLNWGTQELSREMKITSAIVNVGISLTQFDIVGAISMPPEFIVENYVYAGLSNGQLTRLKRIPETDFWTPTITPVQAQPTGYIVTDYNTTAGSTGTQRRCILPYPAYPPNATLFYRVEYQTRPALYTGDLEILQTPTLLDEAIILYCVSRCKLQENDFQAAQAFKSEYNERRKLIIADFADHSDYEFHNIPDRENYGNTYAWEW